MLVRCPRCGGTAEVSVVQITHPVFRETRVIHCQADFQHVHEVAEGEVLLPCPPPVTPEVKPATRLPRLPPAYHILRQALEDWVDDQRQALEKAARAPGAVLRAVRGRRGRATR